eukprot:Rhum_TRINITY_DN11338_c0_g1::Rhum_TRINITY_DN11338_c0_g1_i1::g.44068::m.44068
MRMTTGPPLLPPPPPPQQRNNSSLSSSVSADATWHSSTTMCVYAVRSVGRRRPRRPLPSSTRTPAINSFNSDPVVVYKTLASSASSACPPTRYPACTPHEYACPAAVHSGDARARAAARTTAQTPNTAARRGIATATRTVDASQPAPRTAFEATMACGSRVDLPVPVPASTPTKPPPPPPPQRATARRTRGKCGTSGSVPPYARRTDPSSADAAAARLRSQAAAEATSSPPPPETAADAEAATARRPRSRLLHSTATVRLQSSPSPSRPRMARASGTSACAAYAATTASSSPSLPLGNGGSSSAGSGSGTYSTDRRCAGRSVARSVTSAGSPSAPPQTSSVTRLHCAAPACAAADAASVSPHHGSTTMTTSLLRLRCFFGVI